MMGGQGLMIQSRSSLSPRISLHRLPLLVNTRDKEVDDDDDDDDADTAATARDPICFITQTPTV